MRDGNTSELSRDLREGQPACKAEVERASAAAHLGRDCMAFSMKRALPEPSGD